MRKQEQGETLETFITDVKTLAATFNYGDIVEYLVRDRIVCGILDHQLRERLLRIADLTLDVSRSRNNQTRNKCTCWKF